MGCFCAVVGESHGGTTPLAPGLDVLASPSKRRRNLVLRAGSDGLLLPDDATSAAQQEQEGTAPPAPAGAVAGKPGDKGKEAVQPYTVRIRTLSTPQTASTSVLIFSARLAVHNAGGRRRCVRPHPDCAVMESARDSLGNQRG
jgi:hypothetical protein